MKKIIAILVVFLYSLAVSGIIVQLHFCDNKLNEIAFDGSTTKCCCDVKSNNDQNSKSANQYSSDDCCSDKTIALSLDQNDQITQSNWIQLTQIQIINDTKINNYLIESYNLFTSQFAINNYAANAPPNGNWQHIPYYILLNRITYYG